MRWQYQGLLYVAKAKCNVKRVSPVLVFENDKFSAEYIGGILYIKHQPDLNGGGAMVGGYCVLEYTDGTIETKYYNRIELDKRRGKSQKQTVWENGKAVGQTESNFWQEWEREMYEKTLINATLKRVIETSGTAETDNLNEPEPQEQQPRQVVDVDAEIVEQGEPVETEAKPKTIQI
jgi:recombinational DNA repair protein RecT